MILALVLLGVPLVGAILWLYPAFQFLRDYEQRLKDGGSRVHRIEITVNNILVHVYRPSRPVTSTLILVHGLHPHGIFDERFSKFAEACAESGFQVIAPDIAEFRNLHVTQQSVQIVRTVLDSLSKIAPDSKNVGMLGISFGAGPVFLVASEKKVDYLVSIGGYYNLLHALEYSFSGAHPGGSKRHTHEWGRLIFALNHVEDLSPQQDSEILKESLSLRLQLKVNEAEVLETKLSSQGKELLQGILEGLSNNQKKSFEAVLQRRKKEAMAVSPESTLSRLSSSTRIYLLHGTSDDSIPYEETIELNAALKRLGFKTHVIVTPALTHVDFTKVSQLWETLKLLHWGRMLLTES